MTTSLIVGLLWLVVVFPLAVLVGRALRAAGPRDERPGRGEWPPGGRLEPDLPVHVDPHTSTWWYLAGDRDD